MMTCGLVVVTIRTGGVVTGTVRGVTGTVRGVTGFVVLWSCGPKKRKIPSQHTISGHCIGSPAKRLSNGVSLVGRLWRHVLYSY